MGFGGHALDMINRIKANKELKQSRRDRFNSKGQDVSFLKSRKQDKLYKYKKLSEPEFIKVKERIRKKTLSLRKKETIIYTLLLSFITFLIYLFLRWISN